MRIKKALSVLVITALALSSMSCRATERYRRAQELEAANSPLRCSKEFGRYYFNPGWSEAESNDPYSFVYYPSEYSDADSAPYYLTITYSENEYLEDDHSTFCNDEYQKLVEIYGEDAVNVRGNGTGSGYAFVLYEIITEDVHIWRRYVLRDYEQVLFELTVEDESYYTEDLYYETDEVSNRFRWN